METNEKQDFSGHQKSEEFLSESTPEIQPEEMPEVIPPVSEEKKSDHSNRARKISEWWLKLKKFSSECRRVLKVTQKPTKEEFFTIAKVSALGMAIIGMIGFVLSMIQQLIL